MTIANDYEGGKLAWISSLLSLAEHAAGQGQAETARLARELIDRLRPVEEIYESDRTAREVANGIEDLRSSLQPRNMRALGEDPEMIADFVALAQTALNQVDRMMEQKSNVDPVDILSAFRRIESYAAFLELSTVAELSRLACARIAEGPLSNGHGEQVRSATGQMRQMLDEMRSDPAGHA